MKESLLIATALSYDGENPPEVSATGDGVTAQEIIKIAQDHNVPIYENPQLAALLSTLELGDEIPELLYYAIAEVIALVYIVQGKFPSDWLPAENDQPLQKHSEDAI